MSYFFFSLIYATHQLVGAIQGFNMQRRPALHKGRSDDSDKGGAGADISDPGENLVNCLACQYGLNPPNFDNLYEIKVLEPIS